MRNMNRYFMSMYKYFVRNGACEIYERYVYIYFVRKGFVGCEEV